MSSPLDYREPPTPSPQPPPRSFRTWIALLLVWTIGTIICMVQFAIIGWIIIRIL